MLIGQCLVLLPPGKRSALQLEVDLAYIQVGLKLLMEIGWQCGVVMARAISGGPIMYLDSGCGYGGVHWG